MNIKKLMEDNGWQRNTIEEEFQKMERWEISFKTWQNKRIKQIKSKKSKMKEKGYEKGKRRH